MSSSAAASPSNESSAATGPTSAPKHETSKEKLSPETVDMAVAELRFQTAFYLECIQAMTDGVMVGAVQVQDKRLELLEAGPTVDAETVIVTIVITLVLEGTVGPALASLATRAVFRPMLRATGKAITAQSRRVALMKDLRLYRTQASLAHEFAASRAAPSLPKAAMQGAETYAAACESAANALRADLRGKLGAAQPVRAALNAVSAFAEGNLVAVGKVPGALQNVPGSSKPLTADTSPGVQVVAAAMASASRLRLIVVATHEALEVELKNPKNTVAEATTLLDDYRVDDQVALDQIRASFQLATEAMIWARLVIGPFAQDVIKKRSTSLDPSQRGESSSGYFASLTQLLRIEGDEKLRNYLLVRFGQEVERWALETNARPPRELGMPDTPRPTGWWDGLKPEERQDLLVQYLNAVANGTPRDALRLH